jgi:hypothetical protein
MQENDGTKIYEKRCSLNPLNCPRTAYKTAVDSAVSRLQELGINATGIKSEADDSWSIQIGGHKYPAHFAPLDAIKGYYKRHTVGTRKDDNSTS